MHNVDIAIVGGGMVGLTLALALQHTDLRIAVINKDEIHRKLTDKPEARVSAINGKNARSLEQLGAWQLLEQSRLSPYTHMHVWDKDSFGHIHFDCTDIATTHLGHIVENQSLVNALHQAVATSDNVQLFVGCAITKCLMGESGTMIMLENDEVISAKLIVGADGAESLIRRQANFPLTFKDYGHTAIVGTIHTEFPHKQVARQAFTPTGPLALLPLANPHQCSIVWSQTPQEANKLIDLSDAAFCNALLVASNGVLGQPSLFTPRHHFPLTMRYARDWLNDGVVIIGDAAHTIHPLAGQGANLGMQDAFELAHTIIALHEKQLPIHQKRYLRPFERARKAEAAKMIAAMEGFKQLFGGDDPLKKLIRGVGLVATDKLPLVKRQFVTQAMGL